MKWFAFIFLFCCSHGYSEMLGLIGENIVFDSSTTLGNVMDKIDEKLPFAWSDNIIKSTWVIDDSTGTGKLYYGLRFSLRFQNSVNYNDLKTKIQNAWTILDEKIISGKIYILKNYKDFPINDSRRKPGECILWLSK